VAWLTGWSYRKSHEIVGSTAGAQTDYQIRIKVHYGSGTDSGEDVYLNGKCRADFGDIRFTSDDGVTELPYWMEEKVDGDYATFWVKVPSIPASPDTTTIYIYYGKSDATTTSNGANTFLFFKDFEDGTTQGLTVTAGSFQAYYEGGDYGYVLRQTDTSAGNRRGYWANCNLPENIAVEGKGKRNQATAGGAWNILIKSGSYCYRLMWKAVGVLQIAEYNYDTTSQIQIIAETPLAGHTNWFDFSFKRLSDGTMRARIGTTEISGSDLSYTSPWDIGVWCGADYHKWDNIRVRKYVEPEPSHGAWGSEETPGVAHEVAVAESLGLVDSVVKRADYGTLASGAEKLGLAESITKRVDYRTLLSGTEKLGIIDEAAVQTVILLLAAEKLGLVDGVVKRVDYRTVQSGAEKLGLADSLVKRVDYRTLLSGVERLGLSDVALLKRSVRILMAEKLGLVSRVRPTTSYHLYIEEKLGLIEVGRAGKPIYIEVTEKLGLVDREKILLTIYTPAVTVPANTPKDAPVTYMLFVEEDYITSIDVYFPPGCAGLCRVQAYYGSEQIAPKPTGADFRGDNMLVRCPLRWKVPEKPCPIRFVLWNLDDTYSHTPVIFVTTAEEEQVKPYKPVSEFVNLFKRLLGIRG